MKHRNDRAGERHDTWCPRSYRQTTPSVSVTAGYGLVEFCWHEDCCSDAGAVSGASPSFIWWDTSVSEAMPLLGVSPTALRTVSAMVWTHNNRIQFETAQSRQAATVSGGVIFKPAEIQ